MVVKTLVFLFLFIALIGSSVYATINLAIKTGDTVNIFKEGSNGTLQHLLLFNPSDSLLSSLGYSNENMLTLASHEYAVLSRGVGTEAEINSRLDGIEKKMDSLINYITVMFLALFPFATYVIIKNGFKKQ